MLFDAGGVLVQGGGSEALDSWAVAHGLTRDEVLDHHRSAIGPGWEGGRPLSEIHARLADRCRITLDELPALLAAIHDEAVDPVLADFVRALRPRYRVGIVMNNGEDARRWVCERLGLDRLVDEIVISAEERVAKPDPRIYLVAAARLGVDPQRCLFIDDTQTCVDGALAVGMSAIRFESPDQTLAAVRRQLGVVEHDYDAAGGVLIYGDDVLVLERPSRGETRLPKGHVEPGETDVQAAIREVGEEGGYVDVEAERDLGVQHVAFDFFAPKGSGHHVVRRERYFRMRLVSHAQRARAMSDLKFVPRWMSIADAAQRLTFDVERKWLDGRARLPARPTWRRWNCPGGRRHTEAASSTSVGGIVADQVEVVFVDVEVQQLDHLSLEQDGVDDQRREERHSMGHNVTDG